MMNPVFPLFFGISERLICATKFANPAICVLDFFNKESDETEMRIYQTFAS